MRSAPLRDGPAVLELDWTAIESFALAELRAPWLVPTRLRLPRRVRRSTVGRAFLETHREVQGDRFLSEASARA